MTTIALLPAPPSRNNPATFSADSDVFFGALPVYGTQMSAVALETNAANLAAVGFCEGTASKLAVSLSSFTLGAATATFNIGAGKDFPIGTVLLAVSGTNYIIGTVTSYTGQTLTMSITTTVGSGTYSSWVIGYRSPAELGSYTVVTTAAVTDLRNIANPTVSLVGATSVQEFLLRSGQSITAKVTASFTLIHNDLTCNVSGARDYTCAVGDLLRIVKDLEGTVHVSVVAYIGVPVPTGKAIFGYGVYGIWFSATNLVSTAGVVSTDVTGVGTARSWLAASSYGGDKAIFGYGHNNGTAYSITNLVSNLGVVATDTGGVGTARYLLAAVGYGGDKAFFAYGGIGVNLGYTNSVSNIGVVIGEAASVGTSRVGLAAASYGEYRGIFGYGTVLGGGSVVAATNLLSNTGVLVTDGTGVGTARSELAASGYGKGKAIFGFGYSTVYVNMTNLVSATGVVASDVTTVGTTRKGLVAASYGGDKVVFAYGYTGAVTLNLRNLVSNTGVVAADATGAGTARSGLAGAGIYSS